ncbi:MAG: EI24 domain-containing protein [Tessaracoccus sp.]|nr:EI24 domain-containing protein [Tessaracoccus sp.]
MLLGGFGMWKRRRRTMALGLVPAAIAFAVLAAALTAWGVSLPRVVDWSTHFADGWADWIQVLLRLTLGIVLFGAAAALAVVTFTALTLVIGEPFYERIHRETEEVLGGPQPSGSVSLGRAVVSAVGFVARGVGVAVIVAVLGFLPVVGGALAAVVGVVLTGRLLARELMARAFDARGLDDSRRAQLIAAGRWRVLGFGIATQLCFLIPLGAVVTMPAAVAGATMLSRELIDRREHT